VISPQGLEIPVQEHPQRDLADHPCSSTDTAAQAVLITPTPHGRFRFSGDIGGLFQADAFALVERLEDSPLIQVANGESDHLDRPAVVASFAHALSPDKDRLPKDWRGRRDVYGKPARGGRK
jgi:hypothetical protein